MGGISNELWFSIYVTTHVKISNKCSVFCACIRWNIYVSIMRAGCPSKLTNQAYLSLTISIWMSYFFHRCCMLLHNICGLYPVKKLKWRSQEQLHCGSVCWLYLVKPSKKRFWTPGLPEGVLSNHSVFPPFKRGGTQILKISEKEVIWKKISGTKRGGRFLKYRGGPNLSSWI